MDSLQKDEVHTEPLLAGKVIWREKWHLLSMSRLAVCIDYLFENDLHDNNREFIGWIVYPKRMRCFHGKESGGLA